MKDLRQRQIGHVSLVCFALQPSESSNPRCDAEVHTLSATPALRVCDPREESLAGMLRAT